VMAPGTFAAPACATPPRVTSSECIRVARRAAADGSEAGRLRALTEKRVEDSPLGSLDPIQPSPKVLS
jgi:hypothetical protein